MTDHTKHTIFDFGGESAAKHLDLHAAAVDALREADAELVKARALLFDAEAQVHASTLEAREWRYAACWLAAGLVVVAVIAAALLAAK